MEKIEKLLLVNPYLLHLQLQVEVASASVTDSDSESHCIMIGESMTTQAATQAQDHDSEITGSSTTHWHCQWQLQPA